MVRSAVVALALVVAPLCVGLKAAPKAGFAAQDNKDKNTQADKRAQAAKKYLEAKRLEDAGNISAAVSAYKEAVALDPAPGVGTAHMAVEEVLPGGRMAGLAAVDGLEVAERAYNGIADVMPKFIDACEADLARR